MSAPPSRSLSSVSRSDVGRTRNSNQDSCGEFPRNDGHLLVVVADGMGGHEGGAMASRLAVEEIGRVFQTSTSPAAATLHEGFRADNSRIHAEASRQSGLEGRGTTGPALLLAPGGDVFVAHVGDSRAYRLRDSRLDALTADHSLVADLVRRGVIRPEEAATHPQRNVILRSLGPEPEVEIDVAPVDARPGDRFLLCSDGLWGEVGEADLAAVLQREPAERAAQRLVELANANGGHDNITVSVVEIDEPAREAQATSGPIPSLAPTPTPPPQRSAMPASKRAPARRLLTAAALVGTLLGLAVAGLRLLSPTAGQAPGEPSAA